MKKLISLLLVAFTLAIPNLTAFAGDKVKTNVEPLAYNCYISDSDFNELEHVDAVNNGISTYSTGLITAKRLSLAKDGNNLIINANTIGIDTVSKCGFTYIKLQQYKNGSWVDYKTFNDLYSESNFYSVKKSIAVTKGYNYRLVAQHYAKKNILSTEKINNTTSSLAF